MMKIVGHENAWVHKKMQKKLKDARIYFEEPLISIKKMNMDNKNILVPIRARKVT